jgi:hypothetical protein
LKLILAAVSTADALAAYEAIVAEARARYAEAYKLSAALPQDRRASEKNAAFKALRDTQQSAMRALVASEFSEVMRLRPLSQAHAVDNGGDQ